MSIQLEQSRKKSIEEMKEINKKEAISIIERYYEVVDYGKLNETPAISKATLEFERKKAAGFFDELNQLIKLPYQPDPVIATLQKEIEKLIAA